MFHKLKRFFRNLWDFRRFLWNNDWWDSYHILYMLREKLKVDVKYYKKYHMNAHPEPIINSMELCIMLLNRIIKDDYLMNALRPYNKKYPNWLFKGVMNIPNPKWFKRCGDIAHRQEKQDIEYLFSHMNKYIKIWWD